MSSAGNHIDTRSWLGRVPRQPATNNTHSRRPERSAGTHAPYEVVAASPTTPRYDAGSVEPDGLDSYAPLIQAACTAALGAALLLVGILSALSPPHGASSRDLHSPSRTDVTIGGQARQ